MTASRSQPPPVINVTVEEFTRDLDALLEAVTSKGTHVTITREEIPVAVIVPWAYYRRTEERLARYDVAYWSSWTDAGDFDDNAYARKIADLNDPEAFTPTSEHITTPDPVNPTGTGPQADAGSNDAG